MNVLIACDKTEKSEKLTKLLHRYDKSINVLGYPSTVRETLRYLDQNSEHIDLAIMGIQLADGSALDICERFAGNYPLIFTSTRKSDAYEAIKMRCLDFLIEPLNYRDIENSLQKMDGHSLSILNRSFSNRPLSYKKRFIVKFGDKIQFKNTQDISYIFAEGKLVYIITQSTNRKYIIDHTLDELEKQFLNPEDFFRINRKFIVHISSIEEVRNYANSRLKLSLNPPADQDMIVSREKVSDFKNWLNL